MEGKFGANGQSSDCAIQNLDKVYVSAQAASAAASAFLTIAGVLCMVASLGTNVLRKSNEINE